MDDALAKANLTRAYEVDIGIIGVGDGINRQIIVLVLSTYS
jgi:hypothetical protein